MKVKKTFFVFGILVGIAGPPALQEGEKEGCAGEPDILMTSSGAIQEYYMENKEE